MLFRSPHRQLKCWVSSRHWNETNVSRHALVSAHFRIRKMPMYFFKIIFESLNTSFKKCKVIIMAWLKTSRRNDFSNFAGFKLCECILNLANLPLNLWSIPDKSAKFYVLCKIYHTWSFIALLSDFLHKNCSDGQNVNIFLWDALSEIHYLKATV